MPRNTRQARFAAEYTVDLNATQAAIRAGYAPGCARMFGAKLLQSPAVTAAIAARSRSRLARFGINRERVLGELARAAFADNRALYNDDGSLRAAADLDDDTLAAIGTLDIEAGGRGRVLRLRRLDKLKALKLLGMHFGLFGRW